MDFVSNGHLANLVAILGSKCTILSFQFYRTRRLIEILNCLCLPVMDFGMLYPMR